MFCLASYRNEIYDKKSAAVATDAFRADELFGVFRLRVLTHSRATTELLLLAKVVHST